MKKQLRLIMLTLLCAVAGTMWGATTYSHTFAQSDFTNSSTQKVTLDGVAWDLVLTPNSGGNTLYMGYDKNNNRGVQFGSGKDPASSIKLSTSGISGTIKSVTVNTSGASGISGTVKVSVSGTSYKCDGEDSSTLTTNATDYTFTGSASGKILLEWSQTSSKAIYIKYVTIKYEGGSTITVAAPTFSPAAGEVAEGTDVTISATEGCTLSYTVNGAAQTTTSTTATVTINEATTILAKAVKGEYESDEVTAVYTVKESVPTDGFWVLTTASELKTGDIVIIADKYSSRAMANNNGTNSAPTAVSVTLNADKTKLSTDNTDNAGTLSWIVTVVDGPAYKFRPVGAENYLYCTNTNNGVRVGTNPNNRFEMKDNFLFNSGVNRYIGVYDNKDWRCYDNNDNNIKNTVVAFYKHTKEENIKPQPNLAISDVVLDLGNTANLEVSSRSDGDIDFEFSTQGIATIEKNGENYTVSTTSAGTTTVTAVQAATDTYASETVTFTVKVNPVKPEGALFYETFSSVNGAGGRDDNFGGTSTSSLGQANTQNLTDEENWIFYDAKGKAGNYTIGGAQCVKIGNTTEDKKLETRSINLTGDGVLTFNAAGWNKNNNNLKVTATGGTLSSDTQFTLTNSTWNAYTVNITGATGNLVLTFEGCCGFIDDILVMPTTTPQPGAPVIWMTYSSTNDLDFTGKTDYTAYIATNYRAEEGVVVLTKIEKVPSGEGILIKSNDSSKAIKDIFKESYANEPITTQITQMLVGAPNGVEYILPEEGDKTNFVLAKKDGVVGFYKVAQQGTLAPNKAYLQIPTASLTSTSGANGITFVEDGTTAIQSVTTATADDAWYTLQGVRVAQPTRGLYIHNGKKVVVK